MKIVTDYNTTTSFLKSLFESLIIVVVQLLTAVSRHSSLFSYQCFSRVNGHSDGLLGWMDKEGLYKQWSEQQE